MFLLHPSIYRWDLAILILLLVSGVAAMACIRWLRQPHETAWQRLVIRTASFLCALCFLTVAYGSFLEPHLVVSTRAKVAFPVQSPLKIAVISDMHVGPYKGERFMRRIVNRINRLSPDVVFLAGDFIFDPDTDLSALAPLGELAAPLGVYAVLGNHDQGQYRDPFGGPRYTRASRGEDITTYLRLMDITVLRNQHASVRHEKQSVVIAGIEDMWTGQDDLSAALAGVPRHTPVILLSHNPSIIDDRQSTRAALIVSGHTHGGQVRLPFYGPLVELPTTLGPAYDQGIFTVDGDTTLAITRGIGETNARARLFAWPEILLITTTTT